MKTKLITVVLIIGLFLSTAFFARIAKAESVIIYVPDDYSTIQAAVDAANPHPDRTDTIIVRDGIYTENISVNKSHLTIRSENGAERTIVQAANSEDDVFKIVVNYAEINGFTVKVGSSGINIGSGDYNNIIDNKIVNNKIGVLGKGMGCEDIHYQYSCNGRDYPANNQIVNNTISNNNSGISINYGRNNVIKHNHISNNFQKGIWIDGSNNRIENNNVQFSNGEYPNGQGIVIGIGGKNNILIKNIVDSNKTGIKLRYTDNNILRENSVTNNGRFGIHLTDSNNNAIENNFVLNNGKGILLVDSNDLSGGSNGNVIARNDVSNNIYLGISISDSNDNVLESNNISNTVSDTEGYGIYLTRSKNGKVEKNIISNNHCGIRISGNDNYINHIYLNSFVENTNNFFHVGWTDKTGSFYNSPEPITYTYNDNTHTNYLGNYWDDYTDVDIDGNGIWDNPYTINSDQDSYPLVMPFENYFIQASTESVLEWKFDEGTGDIAYDSSGSNNGIIRGGASWTDGISNSALSFNGKNNYVESENSILLGDQPFTYEAWIKTSVSEGTIIDIENQGIGIGDNKGAAFSVYGDEIPGYEGRLYLRIADDAHTYRIVGTTVVTDGKWHHVVGMRSSSGNDLKLYVDAKEEAYTDITNVGDVGDVGDISSTDHLCVGAHKCGKGGGFFNGAIDEVRVWNKALSEEEIEACYKECAHENQLPNPPNETNLQQLKSDSATKIKIGETIDEREVVFKARVSDPDGDRVKLQMELRNLSEYDGKFDESKEGLKKSEFVASGEIATVSFFGLINENYHWRARVVDEKGNKSGWVEFGDNDTSEVDFVVSKGEENQHKKVVLLVHGYKMTAFNPVEDWKDLIKTLIPKGKEDATAWRKDIKPGDILNAHGTGIIGKAIPGYWDHSGIYVGDRLIYEEDLPFLVEGTQAIPVSSDMYKVKDAVIEAYPEDVFKINSDKGVWISSLASWDYDSKENVELLRVNASDEIKQKAITFALNHVGDSYNLINLKKEPNKSPWYCSELVWAAYYNASDGEINIDPSEGIIDYVSPQGIHSSFHTQVISEHSEDLNVFGLTNSELKFVEGDEFVVYISDYSFMKETHDDIRNYAKNLAKEIEAIKKKEKISNVDIVAHSMGGLVARSYIEAEDLKNGLSDKYNYEGLEYKNDVGKLIMLGTPNHGVPFEILINLFKPIKCGISCWTDSTKFSCVKCISEIMDCADICSREDNLNKCNECLKGEIPDSIWQMMSESIFLTTLNTPNLDFDVEYSAIAGRGKFRESDGLVSVKSVHLNEILKEREFVIQFPYDIPAPIKFRSFAYIHSELIKNEVIRELIKRVLLAQSEDEFKSIKEEFKRYKQVKIKSPGELRVYDSQGNITGLVNNEIKEEIPNSMYDAESKTVIIFNPSDADDYRYEVVGIEKPDEDTYGLVITSVENGETTTFTSSDIPIIPGEVHQYTVDWDALFQGEQGTTLTIDIDGDGKFEKTIISDATLESSEVIVDNPSSASNSGGSGGGVVSTTSPTSTSIIINNKESDTASENVILTLSASNAAQMAISNSSDFTGVSWETYATSKEWVLTSGAGEKKVYAKFRSSNGGVSSVVSDTIILNSEGRVKGVTTTEILDGDIIQCQSADNPFAVYVVKMVGNTKYIRHIMSVKVFNYYGHLDWNNLKQVDSLNNYSLSGWVRYNTGPNGTAGPTDKVYEINGDQTKHWINMTAEQFLTHGGSDPAIYTVNQGELDLYTTGPDVMML